MRKNVGLIMFDEDIKNLDWYSANEEYAFDKIKGGMGYRIDLQRILRNIDGARYLYEMYPNEAQIIQSYAREAVDLADFRQSFIYDEYPDRLLFYQMVDSVYKKYMMKAKDRINKGHMEIEIKCIEKCMKEMTQIIVANEIYNKRNRRKGMA